MQRQMDELSEQVATNRADIDALRDRADASDDRAVVSESRARAASERADVSEARAEEDHRRIGELEVRGEIDRKLIEELRAEGLLSREHSAQLEQALHSSRKIGAAMGIVMANRKLDEEDAFAILVKASQDTNRKLRLVADDVVFTGDVTDLPSA